MQQAWYSWPCPLSGELVHVDWLCKHADTLHSEGCSSR
jgi:hypothetical protein